MNEEILPTEEIIDPQIIDQATGQELQMVEPAVDEQQVMEEAQAMAEMPPAEVTETGPEEAGLISGISKMISKAVGSQSDVIAKSVPTPKPDTPKVKPTMEQPKMPHSNDDESLLQYATKRVKTITTEKKAKPHEIAKVKPEPQDVKQIDEEEVKRLAVDIKQSDISSYDTTDKWQINFDTIKDQDQLQSTIAMMAEKNKDAIQKARGGNEDGVLTDSMLNQMARDLGETPDKIFAAFTREDGFLPPPEYILAARQIMEESARNLKSISQRVVSGDDSSQTLLELANHQQFHFDLMNNYMGVRAQYGRGTRAMGVKMEDHDTNQMMEIMGRVGSGMDLREMAKQIATMDTVEGINRITKAQKSIGKYTADKFFGYYVSSILSGITTQTINVIGTSMNLGMSVADRALAARLGTDVMNESDKVAIGEASAMSYAMLGSLNEARKIAWQVLKSGESYGGMSKLDFDEHADELPSVRLGLQEGSFGQYLVDGLDYGLTFMTKNVMASTDAFYKVLAERAETSAQIFRQGAHEANAHGQEAGKALMQNLYDDIPMSIQKEAKDTAEYVTFQTPLGEYGQKAQKFFGMEGFRWFTPFIKTPVNVMKQGFLDRTPLGFISQKIRDDISSGGARAQMAKARMLNGTILMSLATAAAMSGKLTGTADKDARSKGDRVAGEEPRSFVFDQEDGRKMYVSFDRLEPFSYFFGVAADIAKFYKDMDYEKLTDEDEDKLQRTIDSAILALAENTTNKAFFEGANNLMELLTAETKGKALENTVNNLINGIVPYSGMRRNLAYANEGKVKDPDGVWEYIQANTPIASKSIRTKLDIFGDEIDKKNPIPWSPRYGTNDPVKLELQRITDTIRQAPIPAVSDKIKGVNLTKDEHQELVLLARKNMKLDGRTFYEAVSLFTMSADYQKMIDSDRVIELRGIAHEYDDAAKEYMAEQSPAFAEKMGRLENIKDRMRTEAESFLDYNIENGE